jgi:hypothetical protein
VRNVRALIRLEKHTDHRKQNPDDLDSLAVQRTLTEPVAAALTYSGVGTPGIAAGPPMYVRRITDFGRLLLDDLRAVADDSQTDTLRHTAGNTAVLSHRPSV